MSTAELKALSMMILYELKALSMTILYNVIIVDFLFALLVIVLYNWDRKKKKKEVNLRNNRRMTLKSHSRMSKDELDLLGVSVHHLANNFIEEVSLRKKWWSFRRAKNYKIKEIEDLSNLDENGIIREKGKNATCPIDGKQGAAYVHTLEGADHVGPASIMLSYTWGYTIGDIVDVLENHCKSNNLNPKEVYVWICCLCVNQHRVVELKRDGKDIPFEEFQSVFSQRVTSIGHVLAMMSPWTKPEYLYRVWCIFELFTASQNNNCTVTIEMPSKERDKFLGGLANMRDDFGHIKELFGVLSSTDVENAKASINSDRTNILHIVKSETGYNEFNIIINALIRKWVLQLIKEAARSTLEGVKDGEYNADCAMFHQRVGILFWNLGEYDLALKMFSVHLKMIEKKFGSQHVEMYYPLNNIAIVLLDQGKYEEALDNYSKALVIGEREYSSHHVEVALILSNMGDVYRLQREYDKAIDFLNRALVIRKEKLGQHHVDTAYTLGNIAIVLRNQGKHEEAIEKYQQVMPIYEKEYGNDSVDMARLLNNIAAALHVQGKYEDAMVKYKRSLAIYEKLLGMNHIETIRIRNNIKRLERAMSMKDE